MSEDKDRFLKDLEQTNTIKIVVGLNELDMEKGIMFKANGGNLDIIKKHIKKAIEEMNDE